MAGIIRIHHPNLTKEEREAQMEKIKQATIKFYREVKKNEKDKN